MRKFFGILIIAITFFACLFAAIYLAENVAPSRNSSVNPNFELTNQSSLLVLVVDQMVEKKPNLISAWTLVFYQNQENGIILLPLGLRYMNNFDQLNQQLRIDSKHNISSITINDYQKTFNMKWDGYLLLDLDGLSSLLAWVSHQELEYSTDQLIALTSNHDNAELFLDDVCRTINGKSPADINQIDWERLSPTHLTSPLTKEKLNDVWLSLPTDQLLQCEWFMLIN